MRADDRQRPSRLLQQRPDVVIADGNPDDAVVDAMRQIKRRVQKIKRSRASPSPSPGAAAAAERPLSPLNTNPSNARTTK